MQGIRNGKIHRYPLRVCKLICFTREVYESIKGAVKGVKRKKKPSLSEKRYVIRGRCIRPVYRRNDTRGSYKPSNLCDTPNNKIKEWNRLYEWFREFKEDYSLY